MHKIYRRNRKVYAHNPDPVVTQDPPGGGERGKMMKTSRDMIKKPKVKIPSGFKVLLGNVSFDEAFAYHKSKGKSEFRYKGEKYGTQTEEDIQNLSDAEIMRRYPRDKKQEEVMEEPPSVFPDVKTDKGKKTKTKTNIPYHMKNPYGVGGPKI